MVLFIEMDKFETVPLNSPPQSHYDPQTENSTSTSHHSRKETTYTSWKESKMVPQDHTCVRKCSNKILNCFIFTSTCIAAGGTTLFMIQDLNSIETDLTISAIITGSLGTISGIALKIIKCYIDRNS